MKTDISMIGTPMKNKNKIYPIKYEFHVVQAENPGFFQYSK